MVTLFSITDECRQCKQQFVPRNRLQKYCSRECARPSTRNQARSTRRAEHRLDFIGVDGEGINTVNWYGAKRHTYVMLSVGSETLFNNGEELTYREIFPFLYNQFMVNSDACYVGFYLGYDFTMWLKDLPEDRARMLFTEDGKKKRSRKKSGGNPVPFPVYYGGWEFDILGMKRFKLRPTTVSTKKNPYKWLYVNDTGAFFQTSFLNVIEPTAKKWPTGAPCTAEEFEIVKRGKEHRADTIRNGDVSYAEEMAYYNRLENSILSRTMTILNDGFVNVGIRLKRDQYYGPGQAIQQWLGQKESEGKIVSRKQLEPIIPKPVIDAARASYYGGWFEITHHGHVPGISYEYDITSAYPHIMRGLPCLCGSWTISDDISRLPLDGITYVYATVSGSNRALGAMLLRNQKGNILRPHNATGWYLLSEIQAATYAGLLRQCKIEKWMHYNPCDHSPPLAEMDDLFQQRLAVGKATPTGKAIKLMLNSGYGKFAQSIGTPRFANPVYASLITSRCRTMILDAIASHPVGADSVLMIATDGIYFCMPHPTLKLSEQLGDWEMTEKQNLTLMKPGVYWDDKARVAIKDGKVAPIKSRGISAASLSANVERIDAEFRTLWQLDLSMPVPTLSIDVPFTIVSPKLALARNKWNTCGKVSYNDSRKDSATFEPKRQNPYISGPYIRSEPMSVPWGTISVPYAKSFGYHTDDDIYDEMLTPEGSVNDGIASVIEFGKT